MSSVLVDRRSWLTPLIPVTALCLSLAACNSSDTSATDAAAAAPATLSTATAALQKTLATELPHVVSSSVVTGFNLRRHRSFDWATLWGNLLPQEALAAQLGLGAIWDPQNGSPPSTGDFAVINEYNGGGFTCDSAANTCTNGSTTIADEESLKSYMGQEMNPDFRNSNGSATTLFARLQSSTLVVCAIGQLVPATSMDTDGLPVAGTLALDFPSDTTATLYQPVSSGGCGVSTNDAGASVTATVTAVTSAHYTKLLSVSLGQTKVQVWLKLDAASGTLNILSLEDQRPSGRYAIDRTIVQMSGTNTNGSGTLLFEYLSIGSNSGNPADTCFADGQWQCSFEMHRGYVSESADVGYLVSNNGMPGDPSGGPGAPAEYLQYTVAGAPSALKTCSTSGSTCSGTLALSIAADGQAEPNSSTVYPSAGNSYDACINIADRSIATDATLACDLTGADILASGGASAMINATRLVYVGDVVATLFDHTTASTTLAFTGASDIYTAPNTQ